MRRIWTVGLAVAVVAGVVLLAGAASGQTGVEIPLDRVHRGEPGDRFLEAEIAATNEIGWTCGVTLTRRNNESIHAKDGHPDHGTNLIVESGVNSVIFTDIESESFGQAATAIVIDGDISVFTQIGEDGVSSMGFGLEFFECNPPTTTTTTVEVSSTTSTAPLTSTTATTLSLVTTTTLSPPPINGVDTGGGACADGACDGSLSLLMTWLLIGGVWAGLAGLAWAFIAGATRKETPNE